MTNRACFLSLLLALPFTVARAESQPPEIVRIVGKVSDLNGLNQVTMESDTGHYVLLCNRKAAGCITPAPQGRYYLFTKTTLWQMPGAKGPIDLSFVQNWTANYPNVENIGLVPVDSGPPDSLGLFGLVSWSKR